MEGGKEREAENNTVREQILVTVVCSVSKQIGLQHCPGFAQRREINNLSVLLVTLRFLTPPSACKES